MATKSPYSQAQRVAGILNFLNSRRYGASLEELEEEFKVDRRTLYRDLNVLESIFPMIREKSGDKTVYKLNIEGRPMSFSPQELMALSFARKQIEYLKGTPFEDAFDSLLKKLDSALPARLSAHMDDYADFFQIKQDAPKDYSSFGKFVENIIQSYKSQKALEMKYQGAGRSEVKDYVIHPYALFNFKRGLYIHAFSQTSDGLRTFAVERIKSCRVTNISYEVPQDYSLNTYMGSAFGIIPGDPFKVRIFFHASVALQIKERIWHPSQKIEERKNGLVLSMDVSGEEELVSWILSWGSFARVLEPEWLRKEIEKDLSKTLKTYKRK